MKVIPLSKGYFTWVDDGDFARLAQFPWHVIFSGQSHVYAMRIRADRSHSLMHREILGLPSTKQDKRVVDHIDGNPLNNCRANLRICTRAENNRNCNRVQRTSMAGLKGVRLTKSGKRWEARISFDGRLRSLGCFPLKESAGAAYDRAARELFGEFAAPNSELISSHQAASRFTYMKYDGEQRP